MRRLFWRLLVADHLSRLAGTLDTLLQHGEVFVGQVPNHPVQLLPLLEVRLRDGVESCVTNTRVTVSDLFCHLLQSLAGLGSGHGGSVGSDQVTNFIQTFRPLFGVLGRNSNHQKAEQFTCGVDFTDQLQYCLAAGSDLIFWITNLDH